MPRPHRLCLPDTTYHVYSRCIEWKTLLAEDSAKDMMISILRRTQKKYRFELIFYQVMDSHFHLVIRTLHGGATISRIMQYFKARYAESFNLAAKRIGPFWNERFKDSIVEKQLRSRAKVLGMLWYLAYNPVRHGKRTNPRSYRHGAVNCYLDEKFKPPLKITHHSAFIGLGSSMSERIRKFQEFERSYFKYYNGVRASKGPP
jgi:putative transposase